VGFRVHFFCATEGEDFGGGLSLRLGDQFRRLCLKTDDQSLLRNEDSGMVGYEDGVETDPLPHTVHTIYPAFAYCPPVDKPRTHLNSSYLTRANL
jgi:hypothetical protein